MPTHAHMQQHTQATPQREVVDVEDEMQRYLAEDEAPIGTNILHWWRGIGSTVPSVQLHVQQLLLVSRGLKTQILILNK